jgi:hypothetical protein
LEARTLKRVLVELTNELKNYKPHETEDSNKRGHQAVQKEAFVVWGSTEIAKLFSLSHNSQRLHKGAQ